MIPQLRPKTSWLQVVNDLRVETVPVPRILSDELLVKVAVCRATDPGFIEDHCQTDLSLSTRLEPMSGGSISNRFS